MTAFVALVVLQWIIANAWGRTTTSCRLASVPPTLLYHDGEVRERALERHHLRVDDLHTAARQQRMGSLEQARAILLEGNGPFTVLSEGRFGDGSALSGLDAGM